MEWAVCEVLAGRLGVRLNRGGVGTRWGGNEKCREMDVSRATLLLGLVPKLWDCPLSQFLEMSVRNELLAVKGRTEKQV